MNKYRLVFQYDDFDEYQCLLCKQSFVETEKCNHTIFLSYIYCPLCGTKWDGFFSKQHKKYYLKHPKIELYPRLRVQTYIPSGWLLYTDRQFCPKYWNGKKCISHNIMEKYNEACQKYDKVRLIYMVSPIKVFIVKQKE